VQSKFTQKIYKISALEQTLL